MTLAELLADVSWLPARIAGRLVVSEAGCWIWTGARNEKGYGVVKWRGRRARVHRVVFELRHGRRPRRDRELLHSCDTPACSNPEHTREGTTRQNARDRHAKGRTRGCIRGQA